MAKNNITAFALDTNRYKFLGANQDVTAKHSWTNGERDKDQTIDKNTGNPVWIVSVQIIDEHQQLTDTANVTVSSATEPRIGFMAEISFENLQLLAMSRKEEFGVSYSFTASGIKPPATSTPPKPATTAAKKAA